MEYNKPEFKLAIIYPKLQLRNFDFWDTTPDEIKLEVEKAIEEIESGQYVAHEDVMKNYAKWLKK
jgi:hypothetical protein